MNNCLYYKGYSSFEFQSNLTIDHIPFILICLVTKGCSIETGVWIAEEGNKVGYLIAKKGPFQCAKNCALTNGCIAWTFDVSFSGCWLMSEDYNPNHKGEKDGWISGTKSCGEGKYRCRLNVFRNCK